MATDQNQFPSGLFETVFRGLDTGPTSVFIENDQVNHDTKESSLSGTMTVRPSDSLVRRDENRDLPEGAEAKPHDRDLTTVDYSAQRQVGYEFVPDGEIIEFDNSYNEDALEEAMEGAEAQSNLEVDLVIEDALNGNRNTSPDTVSASSAWSSSSNATPISDINSAFNQSPGADSMILGKTAAQELAQLPDVYSTFSNFDAGGVDPSQLKDWLVSQWGPYGLQRENILLLNGKKGFYNSAVEGQGLTRSWILDTKCFVYHKDAVVAVDPQHRLNPNAEQDRDTDREGVKVRFTRRMDCQITTGDKVVEITGI